MDTKWTPEIERAAPYTIRETLAAMVLEHDAGGITMATLREARQHLAEDVGAEVLEALEAAVDWLRSAPLESGYCCCGSPVEGHGFGDGHSPVDELAYSAGQLEERLLAALARARGETA